MRMSPDHPDFGKYNLLSIVVMAAVVIVVPLVAAFVVRVLLVGAPIMLIVGILIFIASYLENRN